MQKLELQVLTDNILAPVWNALKPVVVLMHVQIPWFQSTSI